MLCVSSRYVSNSCSFNCLFDFNTPQEYTHPLTLKVKANIDALHARDNAERARLNELQSELAQLHDDCASAESANRVLLEEMERLVCDLNGVVRVQTQRSGNSKSNNNSNNNRNGNKRERDQKLEREPKTASKKAIVIDDDELGNVVKSDIDAMEVQDPTERRQVCYVLFLLFYTLLTKTTFFSFKV
jgi:hypothetical protein